MNWTVLIVFLAVSGLSLLLLSLWSGVLSPRARAKTQRLRSIRSALASTPNTPRDEKSALARLDRFLNDHVAAYGRLETLIASAGVEQTALRVLFGSLALFMGAAIVTALSGQGLIVSVLLGVCMAWLPFIVLQHKTRRRRTLFEDKLPEALDFLTRALRAGHSLSVALGMAGHELSPPIGSEFKKVFDEIGFGIPFGESMSAMARRVQSRDLDFLIIALLIQRETGGNLTELLEGLARTVRERMKLKGKVRTLSAEGRFSAVLLGIMPFLLGAILSFLNPAYMSALWQSPQGHNILMSGLVLLVLGFVSLNSITRIKV